MRGPYQAILAGAVCVLLAGSAALAAVSAEEAQKLKTTLTPFGAEKAGNADGTIPAWDGGYTTPVPGFVNGGLRNDVFPEDKPLFSITAQNLEKYADKLSDGTKAMFQKYPDTYRVDVYPTRRTAAAPQWVYDNTFKNATRGGLDGYILTGAYGGIPFPIPQSGAEAMWNHLMRWRTTAWHADFNAILVTANGKQVPTVDARGDFQMPYYFQDGTPEEFYKSGVYWTIRLRNAGPPIRAGEAITGRENIYPDKIQAWVYLTGQRRTRKLPNPCCDTPTPASAGVSAFDETEVFNGRMDRFDWKIVGKQEMYIPYNCNKIDEPKLEDVIGEHHLNPDYVRWELHRVWVIEANLREGMRHQAPKGRFYLDEDTWAGVLSDRWDANGNLWKTQWSLPFVMPDIPATAPPQVFGFYDVSLGAWYAGGLFHGKKEQYKVMPKYKDWTFTPDAMAGEGVR